MIKPEDRCAWANSHPLFHDYHDNEWGVPVYDDQKLFEMLTLESAQSGLSWLTILKKREGYRRAFADFHIETVASFNEAKIEALLQDTAIVRHRQKIAATIANASAILAIQQELGSFSDFVWSYVDGKPISGNRSSKSPLSDQLSNDLKKKGFKFVGSTTVYSFLQAAGMINDHDENCFKYAMD